MKNKNILGAFIMLLMLPVLSFAEVLTVKPSIIETSVKGTEHLVSNESFVTFPITITPARLIAGPDGNIWFSEASNKIGYISRELLKQQLPSYNFPMLSLKPMLWLLIPRTIFGS